MMKSKGKKKVVVNKDENAENWCFVCKDGGDIRICDHKQCLKSYHPRCVGKDDSFLESEDDWTCAWHTCSLCGRSSYYQCYTCPYALCRYCLPASDFLQIRGGNGFCSLCLKLALLIEGKKDYDSDGEKVDFTDRNTCEFLYMEYYNIIKQEEGFESGDLYAAQDRLKMKKCRLARSDSEESDEEEQISDYDGSEYEKKSRRTCKGKRSGREKHEAQTPMKSSKHEFIGWASRSLLEFLASIGKSIDQKLSQPEVTAIINEYVKENKLFNPEKRKMIVCDAQLRLLFKKRTINRNRVRDLLDAHFAENYDESEDDELEYDTEDNDAGILNACKRQRKLDEEKKSQKKEVEIDVPQSCFAAVVVENVKLLYLKRSLILQLLKQPEFFEEKVTGCFVRVKSDPYDYRSRNPYQLMQVKGVKTVSIGENKKETVLLFSAMPKEICMSLLSDDDFSEEECKELRQKILSGELERPTVGDLQQKAKILHKDLTEHWIKKELAVLQNLIDRANEKGWRRELFEYREKQKRLQTPSEISLLLADVPTVIPDINEIDSSPGDIIYDMKSDKSSPKSILQCDSFVPGDGWHDNKESDVQQTGGEVPQKNGNQRLNFELQVYTRRKFHRPTKNPPEEKTRHGHASLPDRKQTMSEKSVSEDPLQLNAEVKTNKLEAKESPMYSQEMHCKKSTSKIEVIELASDNDEDEDANDCMASDVLANQKAVGDLENEKWCILGPSGEQNKCSLPVLKRWSERFPHYASEFKVWKENQNEENAILLGEAIGNVFPKK